MELTDIVAELENNTGKFPHQALERAIEEREAITPVLLETIEKWQDNLEELRENPQINEYVRSAALRSLVVLVAQGVISRELVIEYFEELFTTRLQQERSFDQEPAYIWTNLVFDSARLYPLELKEHIDQAFESELVDQFFIRQTDVDYYLELGKDATSEELHKDSHYSLIDDTIAEMEWWHCFSGT